MLNKLLYNNNYLLSNLLISFFPISFILGNLAINLNIILIILLSLLIFFERKKGLNINLIFFDKIIIIFFFYIIFLAIIKYFQLPEGDQRYQLIIKSFSYLRYLFFYFALRFLLKNYFNFKLFFLTCSACVIFVSLDIIFQYNFDKDIFGFEAVPRRMSGPFGNELIAGSFLSRFSLFAFFLFLNFENFKGMQLKIKLPLFFIFSFIISIGLVLAGNRIPFLIFIVMIFLCFALVKNFRAYFFSSLLIILFSIASFMHYDDEIKKHYAAFQTKIISLLQPFSEDKKIEQKDFQNLTSAEKKYTIHYDGDIFFTPNVHAKEFISGFKTWNENKILGGGLKSFRFNCPKIYINCNNHPHNYYLEVLSDLGIIGFFIIITLLTYLFYKTFFSKKIVIIPFSIILFGEVFPLKTTGSFFSTSNSAFIFLFISLIISMLSRKNLK